MSNITSNAKTYLPPTRGFVLNEQVWRIDSLGVLALVGQIPHHLRSGTSSPSFVPIIHQDPKNPDAAYVIALLTENPERSYFVGPDAQCPFWVDGNTIQFETRWKSALPERFGAIQINDFYLILGPDGKIFGAVPVACDKLVKQSDTEEYSLVPSSSEDDASSLWTEYGDRTSKSFPRTFDLPIFFQVPSESSYVFNDIATFDYRTGELSGCQIAICSPFYVKDVDEYAVSLSLSVNAPINTDKIEQGL